MVELVQAALPGMTVSMDANELVRESNFTSYADAMATKRLVFFDEANGVKFSKHKFTRLADPTVIVHKKGVDPYPAKRLASAVVLFNSPPDIDYSDAPVVTLTGPTETRRRCHDRR